MAASAVQEEGSSAQVFGKYVLPQFHFAVVGDVDARLCADIQEFHTAVHIQAPSKSVCDAPAHKCV